jgi:aspartate-semialdehyde dehydrogenase
MKVAVVGATGMVGQVMLKVLERNLPITELIPVASERSVGNKVKFKDKEFTIVSMNDAIAVKPEIAIFLLAVEHLWSLLQNSPRLEQ